MTLILEVGQHLQAPFAPELVRFLPRDPRPKDKGNADGEWKCVAMAYVEVWEYIKILDRCAYGQWHIEGEHVLYFEGDQRVIVILVLDICGVLMAGVGEEFLDVDGGRNENAATSAWAQAFKRACSVFGLGLGLYFLPDLPSRWVPYDRKEQRMSATAGELLALAQHLYRKTPTAFLEGTARILGQDLPSLEGPLRAPFPLDLIEFLPRPGSIQQQEDHSWTCQANPYIEVWGLVRRLNSIAYGIWSVPHVRVRFARNTVIVSVTMKIGNTPMTGIWQEPLMVLEKRAGKQAKPVADAVTRAFSYAFKRACHLFGLGLYLRFLPPPTVAYSPDEWKKIKAPAREIARALYKAARFEAESKQELRVWVLLQLLAESSFSKKVCTHYGIADPEELSDEQVASIAQRIRVSQAGAA